ncbi:MAG: rRNA pseudouridine synthase [Clostridia bacterium]|nr:rRNA pseudouridine synthase [Clostridia bacterium]
MSKANKKERIDKIISSRGIASRSEAKLLVKKGQVALNGAIVTDSSVKADENDLITIDGKAVSQERYVYIMLNKPVGVVSATDDKRYKTVVDIIPDEFKRRNLFPAGRLDKDTTGFCLITDDGDFAHNILSPSKHITKTYIATLDSLIDYEEGRRCFEEGVVLKDGTVLLSAKLSLLDTSDKPVYKVIIKEGKYHQIKRMFASLGAKVVALERVAMGGLALDEALNPGESRLITADELKSIVENDERF